MERIRVSLLTTPDAVVSSITGIYDVLTCFGALASIDETVPREEPFRVELVGVDGARSSAAGALALTGQRAIGEIERTDIVIAPALMVRDGRWVPGRHPELVRWMRAMHERGAMLCSACSGVLLLAETGLLDGQEATIHWAYARTFRENFPAVTLRQEKVLVAAGEHEQFLMSGASASWHDLVLLLVARKVGPFAAQSIARFMMLQWHADGQAPYEVFLPQTDHGDAAVREVQEWLRGHYTQPRPVELMVQRSGLPERTFKRRFKRATGYAPIAYLQRMRIEDAKRQLERGDTPVDQIGWDVGYADPAAFRRTFKSITGLQPSQYRRKFSLPEFARGAAS